eukprot:Nk52_evm30s147 gene=Nk52_evmTU30s147
MEHLERLKSFFSSNTDPAEAEEKTNNTKPEETQPTNTHDSKSGESLSSANSSSVGKAKESREFIIPKEMHAVVCKKLVPRISRSRNTVSSNDLSEKNTTSSLASNSEIGSGRSHELSSSSASPFANVSELKQCLMIDTLPVPTPGAGQVLIRVLYTTINPSDLSHLQGLYGSTPQRVPFGAGMEGCGQVVATGGGLFTIGLMNKKVGFICDWDRVKNTRADGAQQGKVVHEGASSSGILGGSWSEYVVVDHSKVVVLPDDCDISKCTASLINPLTVLSFIDIAEAGNHRYIVHTAAASAAGRMLIRECDAVNIRVICVVRRADQIDVCRKEGAQFIIDSSQSDWKAKLTEMCLEFKCKLAFDAVGGSMTGILLDSLAPKGEVYLYGNLSGRAISNLDPSAFIFRDKAIRGFWLPEYLEQKYALKLTMWTRKISKSLEGDGASLGTNYQAEFHLAQIFEALKRYTTGMSSGKVLIKVTDDHSWA